MPDGTKPEPGGWNRFAIEVTDLAAKVDRLRKEGVHFRNEIVNGLGGKQILLYDPSGNPVELFEPSVKRSSPQFLAIDGPLPHHPGPLLEGLLSWANHVIVRRATPTKAAARTTAGEASGHFQTTPRATNAITTVSGSIKADRPICNVTAAIKPSAAALAPSTKPWAQARRSVRWTMRSSSGTRRKPGRKIPNVASRPPGTPAKR